MADTDKARIESDIEAYQNSDDGKAGEKVIKENTPKKIIKKVIQNLTDYEKETGLKYN